MTPELLLPSKARDAIPPESRFPVSFPAGMLPQRDRENPVAGTPPRHGKRRSASSNRSTPHGGRRGLPESVSGSATTRRTPCPGRPDNRIPGGRNTHPLALGDVLVDEIRISPDRSDMLMSAEPAREDPHPPSNPASRRPSAPRTGTAGELPEHRSGPQTGVHQGLPHHGIPLRTPVAPGVPVSRGDDSRDDSACRKYRKEIRHTLVPRQSEEQHRPRERQRDPAASESRLFDSRFTRSPPSGRCRSANFRNGMLHSLARSKAFGKRSVHG